MPLIANQPNYLTPVYNPVQYNLTSPVDTDTNPLQDRFILNIYLSATTTVSDFVVGNSLTLGEQVIEWVSSPVNPNQIPTGQTNLVDQVYFIEQILDNNIIFDGYDKEVIEVQNNIYNIRLTSMEIYPFSGNLITWTANTNKIYFDYIFPDYRYVGSQRENYAVEFKLYTDFVKYPFNTTARITGTTSTAQTKNYLAAYYKIYQPTNQHWFNIAETLQTISSTDLYALSGYASTTPSKVFQRDLNSLHNYGIQTFDGYDVSFFGYRRFASNINENKWLWDASKLFDNEFYFDATPYYQATYQFTGLTSGLTLQSFDFNFNYNPSFGDTIRIDDGVIDFYYVCSSLTDNSDSTFRYFALETELSGTAKNFLDMAESDWGFGADSFRFTQTNIGYSKSIVNMSAKTSITDVVNRNITTNISNNISITNISSREIDYIINKSGTTNEIKFLTERPRTNTTIYLPYSTSVYYQRRPITLSIFLSSQVLPSAMTQNNETYYFRTNAKTYNDDNLVQTVFRPFGEFTRNQYDFNNFYDDFQKNGLYHININPTAIIGTTISAASINKMTVNIETDIISEIFGEEKEFIFPYSETFEFDLVELCEYETLKSFAFLNSLGGWDWVDFIDDLTTEYNRSQALVNTRFDSRISKETVDEIVLQNFITENYKVSRVLQSKEEYEWLFDLVKSSRVYFIDGTNYIPIIITGIDYVSIENTNQYKLNLEYRIAQTDISQKSV